VARKQDDYANLRNKIAITLLSSYGLSLIVFFAYSLFTFPEKYNLAPFKPAWTMLQTAAYFIEHLVSVNCAAVLLACSLFALPKPSLKAGREEVFRRLVLSTVVLILILGAAYVALSEGLLPSINARLGVLENRTTVARSYLALADRAAENGERELERAYREYYLTVDPDNETVIEALAALKGRPADDGSADERIKTQKRARLMDLEATELIARANEAFRNEEYYTAYYFADLATALSPPRSPEAEQAKALALSIQRRLASFQADAEEIERKITFETKTQGHSDLLSGELPLVARAYYTFLRLTKKYPKDPEAARYLSEAEEKLETMAFFRDEVESYSSMPGTNRVFFLNRERGDAATRVAAVGGIITTERGTYARDIEAMAFGESGEVTTHFTAQVGKIMEDAQGSPVLYLVGIDRTDSSNTLLPEFHTGEQQNTYRLAPSLEELELLGAEGRDTAAYHLHRLWGMWDTVTPYGYPADPIRIETLKRITSAFTFILLSFFALSAGWRLRPPSGFPVLAGIIVIPALPVAAHFFVRLYGYSLDLIIGSAMLGWGFVPALIVLVALHFALVVLMIAILAAQSLNPREAGTN